MIGEKAAMTSGAFIFSLGCALTYVTINKQLWMVAATYGFVSAFGQNIALIPTLTTAMKWFPNRKGTALGGGGGWLWRRGDGLQPDPDSHRQFRKLQYCNK